VAQGHLVPATGRWLARRLQKAANHRHHGVAHSCITKILCVRFCATVSDGRHGLYAEVLSIPGTDRVLGQCS